MITLVSREVDFKSTISFRACPKLQPDHRVLLCVYNVVLYDWANVAFYNLLRVSNPEVAKLLSYAA